MASWENRTLKLALSERLGDVIDPIEKVLVNIKEFNGAVEGIANGLGAIAELLSFGENALSKLVAETLKALRNELIDLRDAALYYLLIDIGTYGQVISDRTKQGAGINIAADLVGRVTVNSSALKKTLSHSQVKELMAKAVEDLGDNPRYEFDSTILTNKKLYDELGNTLLESFDSTNSAHKDIVYKKAVFDIGQDIEDFKNKRTQLNTQIKPGRPGAYDDSERVGGVAIIFGAGSGQELLNVLVSAAKLFSQLPGFIDAISELEAQYDYTKRTERILELTKVDSYYGLFDVGDLIIGTNNPPEIVQVIEVVKSELSNLIYVDTTTDPPTSVNLNASGNFFDQILKVKTVPDKLIGLLMKNTLVYEATNGETGYSIRGIDTIDVPFGQGRIYPKYGTVKSDDGLLDSTPPDFGGIRLKSMIPGYDDFFTEIINYLAGLENSLTGSIDSFANFLQEIADEIKEENDKLEEITKNLTDIVDLIDSLSVSAGVSMLMIPKGTQAKDLPNYIRSSNGGFGDNIQYCSGVLLLGGDNFMEIFEKIFKV